MSSLENEAPSQKENALGENWSTKIVKDLRQKLKDTRAAGVSFAYKTSRGDGRRRTRITPLRRIGTNHDIFDSTSGDSRFENDNKPSSSRKRPAPSDSSSDNEDTAPADIPIRLSKSVEDFRRIDQLPVEIYGLITRFLSVEQAKSLRLLNRAVESGISGYVFHSVTVPFNAEVFGVLRNNNEERRSAGRLAATVREPSAAAGDDHLMRSTIGNPLDIFRGFGPHIRHFAMTFEVDEQSLQRPGRKYRQEDHEAYWGDYQWPNAEYARFNDRAEMEVVADETSTMTKAFACLEGVTHLALSIDNGLSRIGTVDWSIRENLLNHRTSVIGNKHFCVSPEAIQQRAIWKTVEHYFDNEANLGPLYHYDLLQLPTDYAVALAGPQQVLSWHRVDEQIVRRLLTDLETVETPSERAALRVLIAKYPSGQIPTGIDWAHSGDVKRLVLAGKLPKQCIEDDATAVSNQGLFYTRAWSDKCCFDSKLNPNHLTKGQREWLMETAWAQDAFISSYMLAITDNHVVFSSVSRLTLATLPSRWLGKLQRMDFWNALPNLSDLEIMVLPDWRSFSRDEACVTQLAQIEEPSTACTKFFSLLFTTIGGISNITTLKIGWASGGEHQTGLSGRNTNLLPAPLTRQDQAASPRSKTILSLPHVKTLTISNAWAAPNVLQRFVVTQLKIPRQAFSKLVLDSISLTCYPKPLSFAPNPQMRIRMGQLRRLAQMANSNLGDDDGLLDAFENNYGSDDDDQINRDGSVLGDTTAAVGYTALQQVMTRSTLGDLGTALNPIDPNDATLRSLALYLGRQAQGHLPIEKHGVTGRTYRPWSWPYLLYSIRQACIRPSQPDRDFNITFLSCGYAHAKKIGPFRSILLEAEYALEQAAPFKGYLKFEERRNLLVPFTMHANQDDYLGSLCPALPADEMEVLERDWALHEGWPSTELWTSLLRPEERGSDGIDIEDEAVWGRWGTETKKAAVYDGYREGGTGRFSGKAGPFERIQRRSVIRSESCSGRAWMKLEV